MNKLLTALLTTFLLQFGSPTIAAESEPCDKNLKTIDKGDKIVICFNEIKTNGLILKVFNPEGMIIDSATLDQSNDNYEIDKPESGIYWVSMKNGSQLKFQKIIVR